MAQDVPVADRCAFVAVTARDLAVTRRFWVDVLGCPVIEESQGRYVMVDAGGLRLCLDAEDGHTHRGGSHDAVIGLHVTSLDDAVARLRSQGVSIVDAPRPASRGRWAGVRDPDGRSVVLTEGA